MEVMREYRVSCPVLHSRSLLTICFLVFILICLFIWLHQALVAASSLWRTVSVIVGPTGLVDPRHVGS